MPPRHRLSSRQRLLHNIRGHPAAFLLVESLRRFPAGGGGNRCGHYSEQQAVYAAVWLWGPVIRSARRG
ncbi:hypothetical protein KCP69_19835 [Salmonella enterica subsp. enterica]|nr:hypothetical protein KCP69_19835 [Salmonella enterica subsp. enterica]